MSHAHTQPTRPRCDHDELQCTNTATTYVVLIDGESFELCALHAAVLLDETLTPDVVADVVPLNSTTVDVVQRISCVGYELHVEHVTVATMSGAVPEATVEWRVRPDYAREALCTFDTYRAALLFAAERAIVEFETEVAL